MGQAEKTPYAANGGAVYGRTMDDNVLGRGKGSVKFK